MKELPKELVDNVDTFLAIDAPAVGKIVQCAFVAGMELSMRICRNRAKDIRQAGKIMTMAGNEAEVCAGLIRIVQVEIGSGRAGRPEFTKEELEEMNRIA